MPEAWSLPLRGTQHKTSPEFPWGLGKQSQHHAHQAWQRQGVGTALVQEVLYRLPRVDSIGKEFRAWVVVDATDEAAIVSHRPFGARPNRPRSLVGRIRYRF